LGAKVLILPAFLILILSPALYAYNADSVFSEAGKHYENKEYRTALNKYQSIMDNGYQSASLYYNLGNCYIKENQFGYAILYYLKAKRLSPNDEDIETNLAFARQFMPTRLEGVKINPVSEFFNSAVGYFTLDSLAWITSIFFVAFFLIISLSIFLRYHSPLQRILIYSILSILIIAGGMTTYKYRIDIVSKKGVVVTDEANIYSSPNESGDIEFVGSFGLIVEIEKEANGYYLVLFENKRKGWINRDEIGVI
jgi:tetratricopeptide (TPR) repeat protein